MTPFFMHQLKRPSTKILSKYSIIEATPTRGFSSSTPAIQAQYDYPDVSSRPFRSMLYVPASNTRALKKLSKFTSSMKPDSVMYDLEDGVGPASKEEARNNLRQFFEDEKEIGGQHPKHFGLIRVNRMDTPWFEHDVAAVVDIIANQDGASKMVNGVILPKIEGWEDVNSASNYFQTIHGIAPTASAPISNHDNFSSSPIVSPIPFWAMMETPQAILSAPSIASHPSIQGLILGTNDLSKEIQLRPHSHKATRSGLTTSLQLTILAARAHNKLVIDGVYNHFNDNEGFRLECIQGKEWGMDGKTLIHPNQLSATNEIFAPSEEEIDYARKVIECWENASKDNSNIAGGNEKFTGVAVLNGLMIEELHVQSSRKLLERADIISSMDE